MPEGSCLPLRSLMDSTGRADDLDRIGGEQSSMLSDEIKNEYLRVKKKGAKAILKWYWDYFKIHTVVAVALIAGIVSIAKTIITAKPTYLNAIFLNSYGGLSSVYNEELTNAFEAQLIAENVTAYSDKKKQDLPATTEYFDFIYDFSSSLTPGGANDQMEIATMQKLVANTAARELDLLVADASNFLTYAYNDMFGDLREYFDEETIRTWEEEGRLYYIDMQIIRDNEEADNPAAAILDTDPEAMQEAELLSNFILPDPSGMTDPVPLGVMVTDAPFLSENELYGNVAVVASIPASTDRGDAASRLVRFLLQSSGN